MKAICFTRLRLLLCFAAAAMLLLLWPGRATAATVEQTLVEGDRFAAVDLDPDRHGSVEKQFTVTTLADKTCYDILYATGTAAGPSAQYCFGRTDDLSTEPTTALLRPTNYENTGILLWIRVRSGSVKLTVSDSAPVILLTPVRTDVSPLQMIYNPKGDSKQFRIANAGLSAIPIVMGGTSGAQIKHYSGTNNYETYRFTSTKLYKYTYKNGKRTSTESIDYETAVAAGGNEYFCACLQLEASPIGATGWFQTTAQTALFAMPADWLEYEYAGGGTGNWDGGIEGLEWRPLRAAAADYDGDRESTGAIAYTIQSWGAMSANEVVFSPAGGTYEAAQTVTISCATEGAQIRYTTDGTQPTAESAVYTGPLTVSEDTTIRAVAMKEGLPVSRVATAVYVIHESESDLQGTGTADDPFRIDSAAAWDALAASVANSGGKYYRLTRDISVTTMIGTLDHPFSGDLDGAGHTLTFTSKSQSGTIAPFSSIEHATIRNLHVAGSISSSYASGLIGQFRGGCTVTNCRVSVAISGSSDIGGFCVFMGGLMASGADHLTITGSVFDGKITGGRNWIGCFVAEGSSHMSITDCIAAPQSGTAFTGGTFYSETDGAPALNNCLYMQSPGAEQGRQALSVTADAGVTMDPGQSTAAYDVSGITVYAAGMMYDGMFYAGAGDTVALGLSKEAPEGCRVRYSTNAGTLTEADGAWTLVMPDEDVTISAEIVSALLGTGTADDPWQIGQGFALTTLSSGWYQVTGNASFDSRLIIDGDVHLTLGAGTTLTAAQGVNVSSGDSLTIDGTGTLDAVGCEGCAGIGGGINGSCGAVTINGGTVNATGSVWGAGIGGGKGGGNGGRITINGGRVTAQCYDPDNWEVGLAAGIGGGDLGSGGIILITGGTVYARGNRGSAGIGGGGYGSGGSITITGGTVTAIGSRYDGGRSGAGIGAGRVRKNATSGDSGDITITGGTVTAIGGETGQAIGVSHEVAGSDSGTLKLGEVAVYAGETQDPPAVRSRRLEICRGGTAYLESCGHSYHQGVCLWCGKLGSAPDFGEADFTLPADARTIGESAFEGAAMCAVDARGCTRIGEYAFRDCAALMRIRLGKDCEIAGNAFSGCASLTAIFAPAGGSTEQWALTHDTPFVDTAP